MYVSSVTKFSSDEPFPIIDTMTAMRPHENAHHTGRKLLQEMGTRRWDLLWHALTSGSERHHHPPGRIIINTHSLRIRAEATGGKFLSPAKSRRDIYTAPGINAAMPAHIIKSSRLSDITCLLLPVLVVNKIGLAAKFPINYPSIGRIARGFSSNLLSENRREKK